MGRFLILFGIALILVTVGIFIFSLVGMQSEQFASIVEPLICNTEETFTVVTGSPHRDIDGSTVQNFNMYCRIGEKIQRDVSGTVIGGIIAIFVGGLLLGIGLIFWGAFRALRNRAKHYMGMVETFHIQPEQANVIDLQSSKINYEQIPPQAQEIMRTVLQSITGAIGGLQAETLAERLQQLEEARQQGLISQQEYDQIRAALLDRMDD